MCVYCVYATSILSTCGGQKWVQNFLELELQMDIPLFLLIPLCPIPCPRTQEPGNPNRCTQDHDSYP